MSRRALFLAVLAATCGVSLALSAPASAATTPAPSTGGSELFHLTLVVGSRQASTGTGELPAAVAKALDDVKGFLPYRSYRLADAVLLRGGSEAHTRLHGPGDATFTADLVFHRGDDGDGGFQIEHLELRPVRPAPAPTARTGDAAEAMARALEERPEPLIDASFRIARGETVVVGSSTPDGGDDALILLLTAMP
jgi:hypothetical protein